MGSLRHCEPDVESLLTDFRHEILDGRDHTVLAIRPAGEIAYVNPAYFRFAAENGGDRVPIDWVETPLPEASGGLCEPCFDHDFPSIRPRVN